MTTQTEIKTGLNRTMSISSNSHHMFANIINNNNVVGSNPVTADAGGLAQWQEHVVSVIKAKARKLEDSKFDKLFKRGSWKLASLNLCMRNVLEQVKFFCYIPELSRLPVWGGKY